MSFSQFIQQLIHLPPLLKELLIIRTSTSPSPSKHAPGSADFMGQSEEVQSIYRPQYKVEQGTAARKAVSGGRLTFGLEVPKRDTDWCSADCLVGDLFSGTLPPLWD